MQTNFKLAVVSLLLALPTSGVLGTGTKQNVNVEAGSTVYVCTGPKATTYHKTNHCSGLNRCNGSVVEVSLSKAKQMGRRPCKKCY